MNSDLNLLLHSVPMITCLLFIPQSLYDKDEKEKAELNRRILELTTDLNRKKFELEQAETRGQWSGEQQAETISQLRQALKEKDDVIQVSCARVVISLRWSACDWLPNCMH